VRVTAQLIDAGSDAHLWAEPFDHDLGDLFELQDAMSATRLSMMWAKAVNSTTPCTTA